MHCSNCGAQLPESAKFCKFCGGRQFQQDIAAQAYAGPTIAAQAYAGRQLLGFSPKIADPAFKKYVKNSNRWAAIFSIILAVVAVVGFYIAGETGADNMENPQSLYIGLGVGGMFVLIALFQILGRKRGTTWDGTVEDKNVKEKTQRHTYGDNEVRYEDHLEYSVIIRSDQGKRHTIRTLDDDTMYNYYRIGDRVRHHAGLNSYEKYDKTGDKFIPCNACATLCDIGDDYCFRCKCPLLK